eukprot:m.135239 g.135239  ORF g.135239 m.135239 type:complete len:357 (-) comp9883_c0_seq2:3935-5005(-)
MACFLSEEQREQRQRNRLIEESLKRTRRELRQEIKLLLLGAGESGKSTVVKQMRIIHGAGYSTEDKRGFIPLVHENIMTNTRVLLEAAEAWGISHGLPEAADTVWAYERSDDAKFSQKYAPAVKALWQSAGIQQVIKRSNEIQLNDSAVYYFSRLDTIAAPDYLPVEQDILRSRVATTGIVEFKFAMSQGKTIFRMIDVGGQRSERRKWIHCFEDVTSITFIVACSGYNQVCVEDSKTNRMEESLALWDHIVNYPIFQNASMILFLNKVDLLQQKIKVSDLADFFPAFDGPPGDAIAAQDFIEEMFLERVHTDEIGHRRNVYPHYTTATDTNNIKHVIDSVRDTILQHNLRAYAVV